MSGQNRSIDPKESYVDPTPQCPTMARHIHEIHRAAHTTNDRRHNHHSHHDYREHHHRHHHSRQPSTHHRTPAHEADSPGSEIYVRFEYVPHREATACTDVWQALGSAVDRCHGGRLTNELCHVVFAGGWTTAHSVGDVPQPGPRDDDKIMVRCGVWRKDLPEISVSRRVWG